MMVKVEKSSRIIKDKHDAIQRQLDEEIRVLTQVYFPKMRVSVSGGNHIVGKRQWDKILEFSYPIRRMTLYNPNYSNQAQELARNYEQRIGSDVTISEDF